MLLISKNNIVVLDSLAYLPIIPGRIDEASFTKEVTMSHWKVNNSVTYLAPDDIEKAITIYNAAGALKTNAEIYEMLSSWDDATLLNAFFNRNLEAGNISGGGEEIDKILIRRLSSADGYREYQTIGEIPYNADSPGFNFRDYFIESGQVYMYSVQPITVDNHYGRLQNGLPGMSQYGFTWILDSLGTQIQILDSTINSISYNTKDTIVETIGGTSPFVNKYSNLDYRTFNISGTIASEFDLTDSIRPAIGQGVGASAEIQRLIDRKFMEKTGGLPEEVSNSQRHYSFERHFREHVIDVLKNGQQKLFKSPTEGLILVKLTNVTATPKVELGRTLYNFTATATEVGAVTEEALVQFKIGGETNGE